MYNTLLLVLLPSLPLAVAHDHPAHCDAVRSRDPSPSFGPGGPLTPKFRNPANPHGEVDLYDAEDQQVSFWHNVPYLSDVAGCYHMVVEVPLGGVYKMEIQKEIQYNPIAWDDERVLQHPMPGNYGAFPQTWLDPNYKRQDGDPLDVIDVGRSTELTGSIISVKVLGALPFIDEGLLDWKVLAINILDEKAHLISDVKTLEAVYPGKVDAIRNFFRNYKTGKTGSYASGEIESVDDTIKLLQNAHEEYSQGVQSGRLSVVFM